MPLINDQKIELEAKIADGIIPPCPVCGSSLSVSSEQVGKSGANGRNYSCSKDKLLPEQREKCDLKPGIAYVGWKQNLRQSLRNRVVQLALVGIGSISLGGFAGVQAGWISFDESEQLADSSSNNTTTSVEGIDSAYHFNKVEELKSRIIELESIPKEELEEDKWKLGYAMASPHEYKNSALGLSWIREGIDKNEISADQDKLRVANKLYNLTLSSSAASDWQLLKNFVNNDVSHNWNEKNLLKARIYYNLQRCTPYSEPDRKKAYSDTALSYYSCALKKNAISESEKTNVLMEAKDLITIYHGSSDSFDNIDEITEEIQHHQSVICN